MLNSPRLLLLSGQPGAGTSVVAKAIAHVLTGAGLDVVYPAPAVRIRAIQQAFAELFESAGAEPLALDEVAMLMAVEGVAEVLAVHDALATPGADVVIWDAGHADRLMQLWATLDALPALVARFLTPATIALGVNPKLVRDLADQLLAMRDILVLESTWHGVVVTPEPGVGAYVERHRAATSLFGASVDCAVVNRFPRAKDGWPRPWAQAMRRRAKALAVGSDQIVFLPWLLSDPSGERNLRRMGLRFDLVGGAGRPRPAEVVAEADGTFSLHLHLPRVPPMDLHLGRLEESLVVKVGNLHRIVPLSPVLTRCLMVGARFHGDVLIIRFVRDTTTWSAHGEGQPDD